MYLRMIQLPSCSSFPAGKGHGLTITPYATGHMVGGAMWKIVKEGEEDIIYAVDYNHKKERYYFTEQLQREKLGVLACTCPSIH